MEPPPFGDGNFFSPISRPHCISRLQWSHRLSVMEITPAYFWLSRSTALQWSHRLSVMEIWISSIRMNRRRGLQWSHRLSVMEIRRLHGLCRRGVLASMEPPPFGDGNWCPPPSDELPRNASMEPPPFGDGNVYLFACARAHKEASMEPPPFGDGNIKENTRSRSSSMRLQWSHRLSVMEICGPP